MDVLTHLLHDAAPLIDLGAHRARLAGPYGWTVGPLVVPDERLSRLGEDEPGTAVSVVIGGGAGGLVALAQRTLSVRVVAVETTLRDLDDLAGNAARVVSAAEGLAPGTTVFVGIPGGLGFVDAVETVEAAGLQARVALGGVPTRTVAEQLSVLVEADLPFKVAGLDDDPFGRHGVASVLMAVEALVDGATADDAVALLEAHERERMLAGLRQWDAATHTRVGRRVRGLDCADLDRVLAALADAGLLTP